MQRVHPPIDGNPSDHAFNQSVIETCAGFTAGVVSTFVVHPFDVIKTRLQVDQSATIRVGGSLRMARDIARNEGVILGFARGITPNLIGNSTSWALYFLWYGNFKDRLHKYRGGGSSELRSTDYLVASAAAGVATAVLTNPIWVLKTRMLSSGRKAPGAYSSVTDGVLSIYRNEGLVGFYRGLVPSLFGVSHGAIQFMAYEELKSWRRAKILRKSHSTTGRGSGVERIELGNLDVLALSAFSKTIAGITTYPYQVVRSRLQMYNAAQNYSSATDVVRQVLQKEGVGGFYKGLGPNLVRIVPATCVTFLVYENTKSYLGKLYYEPHLDERDGPAAKAATAAAKVTNKSN